MSKERNASIDAMVLAAIRSGPMSSGDIVLECELEMRDVDRSLQRLRKANAITFPGGSRRWKVVS